MTTIAKLFLLLPLLLVACGGAVKEEGPAEEPFRYRGPVENAFCGAVQWCDDNETPAAQSPAWVVRHAEETCGAGDAFDVAMDPAEAAQLVAEMERDRCRYNAPPALVRFYAGAEP